MYNLARYIVKNLFIEIRFLKRLKNFKTVSTFAEDGNVAERGEKLT